MALCFLLSKTLGRVGCLDERTLVPQGEVIAERILGLGKPLKAGLCLKASEQSLLACVLLTLAYLLSSQVELCGPPVTLASCLNSFEFPPHETSKLPMLAPRLSKTPKTERVDGNRETVYQG